MPQKINPKDLEPILRTQIGPEIGPRAVQAFTNQGFHGTIGPYSPQEVLMDRVRNSFAGHLADKLVGLFGTPEELLGNVSTGSVHLAGDVTSLLGAAGRGKMTEFGKMTQKLKELLSHYYTKNFGATSPSSVGYADALEQAEVFSGLSPESLKSMGISDELANLSNEYTQWHKKRDNLKNLGLPHPTLDLYTKTAQDPLN